MYRATSDTAILTVDNCPSSRPFQFLPKRGQPRQLRTLALQKKLGRLNGSIPVAPNLWHHCKFT